MTRKRKRSKEARDIKLKDSPMPKALQPKKISDVSELEELTLAQVTKFSKADDAQVVIMYQIPMRFASDTEAVRQYKMGLESSLVKSANANRHRIERKNFHYKALPIGNNMLIKAYYYLRDASGQGIEQHQRTTPPQGREGMIVE